MNPTIHSTELLPNMSGRFSSLSFPYTRTVKSSRRPPELVTMSHPITISGIHYCLIWCALRAQHCSIHVPEERVITYKLRNPCGLDHWTVPCYTCTASAKAQEPENKSMIAGHVYWQETPTSVESHARRVTSIFCINRVTNHHRGRQYM